MKNVVLLVMDACRADHLSCYGYKRKTSPFLDSLAKKSLFFKKAYSTSSWTKPSMASILTGKLPEQHGVHSMQDDLHETTIADELRSKNYLTCCIAGIEMVAKSFGFTGFDEHRVLTDLDLVKANADSINSAAKQWITSFMGQIPFFLYLHYVDTHDPFIPPETKFGSPKKLNIKIGQKITEQQTKDAIDLYDSEIYFNDKKIKELFDWFEKKNLLENTLFIITADHGELFMESGFFGHAFSLDKKLLHVPLIIFAKDLPAKEINFSVSLVDIFDTIKDYLGEKKSNSLIKVKENRECFAEYHTNRAYNYAPKKILKSRIKGDLQKIETEKFWSFAINKQQFFKLKVWGRIAKGYLFLLGLFKKQY